MPLDAKIFFTYLLSTVLVLIGSFTSYAQNTNDSNLSGLYTGMHHLEAQNLQASNYHQIANYSSSSRSKDKLVEIIDVTEIEEEESEVKLLKSLQDSKYITALFYTLFYYQY